MRPESVEERSPLECPLNRAPLESPLDQAECGRWAQGPFESLDAPAHGSLKVVRGEGEDEFFSPTRKGSSHVEGVPGHRLERNIDDKASDVAMDFDEPR